MSEMDAYRALYIAESRENHETIVKNLLVLENGPDEAAIAEIFRSAHSLKGMSATMGFKHMERVCHAMEDVFQLIRSGQLEVHQDLVDLLLAASDDIELMLDDIESDGPGTLDHLEERVQALLDWKAGQNTTGGKNAGPPQPENIAGNFSTQNVGEALLEEEEGQYQMLIRLRDDCDSRNLRGMLLLQNLDQFGTIIQCIPERAIVEDGVFDGTIRLVIRSDAGIDALKTAASVSDVKEVLFGHDVDLSSEKAATGPAGVIKPLTVPDILGAGIEHSPGVSKLVKEERVDKSREVKNIRVDITRLDQMMNLIEDLVINRGRLAQIARKFQIKELDETLNMVGRSVSDLQNLMMNIRMIPLSHIFNRFPRTVRDLAHKEEKEVEFTIEGGDTELDRSIMDGLNDPLLHLIRNGVDHGIEKPEIRMRSGKPGKGKLNLIASRDRDNVVIVIEDDGAGINREKVAKKAIERGLITELQAVEMTDAVFKSFAPLKRIKFPVAELSLITMISLRFIPVLLEEAITLKKAQVSRGATFDGGLIRRTKKSLPLLVPLFVSSFRKADELALALDARGFRSGQKRTSYQRLAFKPMDYLFLSLILSVWAFIAFEIARSISGQACG